jgi:cytochrome P450
MTAESSNQGGACPHGATSVGERYNPFDPAFSADPYAFYRQACEEAPVCYSPLFDAWVVTGHAELMTVLKEPNLFSSAHILDFPANLPPEVHAVLAEGYPIVPGLFNNDPPAHTRVRALFSSAFTPRRVAEMEPGIRALAHSLVDRFAADGHADIVSQFAFLLPMTVIADLVGVPREDIPQVKRWHDGWMTLLVPGLPAEQQIACAHSIVAYQRYYAGLIAERRANPRDDLLTAMVEARLEGSTPFTTEEIIIQLVILLSAGHETTTSLISGMLLHLLRHPDQWQALLQDQRLIPAAIEETLRFEAPVQMEPRQTTRPAEVGGVTIPEGASVHPVFGAANRDPQVAADPERFDIHRPGPNRHVAFGWGTHFCIGAALARLEGRVAIETLIERLPNLRLAPGFAPEYAPSFFFRGCTRLPLEWDVA